MEKQIIKSNVIIAEFMDESGEFAHKKNKAGVCECLHYNDEWDWIMPVVKKIYSHMFDLDCINVDLINNLNDALLNVDITNINKRCVECINVINQHKEEKPKLVYPICNKDEDKVEKGLYLALQHGFENGNARNNYDGWGEDGALIGPLKYVHGTYITDFKIEFVNAEDSIKYGLDEFNELEIINDCVVFDNMEYGDYTVFIID